MMPDGRSAGRVALFHYLNFRASAHETEDPERVKQAILYTAHTQKHEVKETAVEGSHKNRIRILELESRSNPAAKEFFADLARQDPGGFARLVEEVPKRLDEHLNLYLRVDKQEAYQGRLRLSSDEDSILVRAKLRSFAPKRAQSDGHEFVTELRDFFHKLSGE